MRGYPHGKITLKIQTSFNKKLGNRWQDKEKSVHQHGHSSLVRGETPLRCFLPITFIKLGLIYFFISPMLFDRRGNGLFCLARTIVTAKLEVIFIFIFLKFPQKICTVGYIVQFFGGNLRKMSPILLVLDSGFVRIELY